MSRDKDFYRIENIITRQILQQRTRELQEAEARSESPTQGNYLSKSAKEKLLKTKSTAAAPSGRSVFSDKMVKTDCSTDFYDCKIGTVLPQTKSKIDFSKTVVASKAIV